MFVFGHLGIGSKLVQPLAKQVCSGGGLSKKWILLGTVLPDLLDKPLYYAFQILSEGGSPVLEWLRGTRSFGHTGLLLLGLAAFAAFRRSGVLSALLLGVASHLLLDPFSDWVMSVSGESLHPGFDYGPSALFWPLTGWWFPARPPRLGLSEHLFGVFSPVLLSFEVLGAGILCWDFRIFSRKTKKIKASSASVRPILAVPLLMFFMGLGAHADALPSEFVTGFNQAWFKDSYSRQWLNGHYEADEARRILDLARDAQTSVVRMWFFEGLDPKGLTRDASGKFTGVHPELLKNFEQFLHDARERGVRVYVTFFAPLSLSTTNDQSLRKHWLDFLNLRGGVAESFRDHVLPQFLGVIAKPELRSTVFALDLMNEIDHSVGQGLFENAWFGVNAWICKLRSWVKDRVPDLAVTASIGWPWVPFFTRAAADVLLDPNPHPSCVDFFDLHLYNDTGRIPNCEKIREMATREGKKVYLGEFGQFSGRFSDSLQSHATRGFLQNAKACGFSGALGWRLSDIRPGYNSEARHSFEAFGKTRPAYEVMRAFSDALK